MNLDRLISFVEPYYINKDIMHNMWHIELVKKEIDKILNSSNYDIDYDSLIYALYFHGLIYREEDKIRKWLIDEGLDNKRVDRIINIAWESQRSEIPSTLEGKILHDAHVLEGGKTYLVIKTLITGSLRNQTLEETLKYMKDNVLEKNKCYLKETIPLCKEMNKYADKFYEETMKGIE